jgi:nitrous oxidase accessory protein NosD
MEFFTLSSHTAVVPQARPRKPFPGVSAGLVLGVLVLLLSGPYASAAILRVPQSYATVQAGIAAASAGDTVLVAPGVYFESVTMKPGVHIQGEPGAILDGSQGTGEVVSAASGVERTAVLSGFVVRRGR